MNKLGNSSLDENDVRSPDRAASSSGLVPFALRATIVAVVIAAAISTFLPDVQSLKSVVQGEAKRALQNESIRVRLMGLFTNNPAVHWQMSLIEERKGDLAIAITEIELAIGLLELHSADKAVIDRYAARLKELETKSAGKQPGAGG